jgi:serine/threonine-protein phosphatase 5
MAATGWTASKAAANAKFGAKKYEEAITLYSTAIEELQAEAVPQPPSSRDAAILFANRAFCEQKLEQYGSALRDASSSIENDATYAKAFYRRGSANLFLGHTEEALADFRAAVKLEPKSREARQKLDMCRKAVRALLFSRAIETDDEPPVSEGMDQRIGSMADPGSDYAGPRLPSRDGEMYITPDFMDALLEWMRSGKIVHAKYAYWIVNTCLKLFRELPTLQDPVLQEGEHINVCGDTHGQFYDLLNLFSLAGKPSETNRFLFNGDFVDRGSWSVEVVLTLLGYKCLYPEHFLLHRGNHETTNMNKMYGFEGEVHKKFSENLMDLFTECFNFLPLGSCLHSSDDKSRVLVVHGGLFSTDGVTLDDLRKVNRNMQPPESGLMCEMLWSDPQPFPGRAPSKRGVGISFGPDVTHRFCDENSLDMVVRSHEVKEEGYLLEADGRLCTIFSAPNYCDQVGNKGAFIRFACENKGDQMKLEPAYTKFEAVPHPDLKPMAYANNFRSVSFSPPHLASCLDLTLLFCFVIRPVSCLDQHVHVDL